MEFLPWPEILKEDAAKLQMSALRVLSDLTPRRHHPHWKHVFKVFQENWILFKAEVNSILSLMDVDSLEEKNLTFRESCNFSEERDILQSTVDRITESILDFHHRLFLPSCRWIGPPRLYFVSCLQKMVWSLERVIQLVDSKDVRFCCDLQCFPRFNDEDEVDGRACEKCKSFSYCRCDCVTYMTYMNDTHCCPLFCSQPTLGICILCPGACLCRCHTFQKDMRLLNGSIRVQGQAMEAVVYRGSSTHCCEKKCFPIPDRVVRGLACATCEAVNFCKCKCMSWEEKRADTHMYLPLVKPEGGWQTVTEKDLKVREKNVCGEVVMRNHYHSIHK